MYSTLSSMLQSYGFWIIILGIMGMAQKKQEGEPPEWRKRALTKEQQIRVNEQYKAYRKELYKDYPTVDKFEMHKRIWAFSLVLIHFITAVLRYFALSESTGTSAAPAAMVVSLFFQLCGSMIILGVFFTAMGPKWKYAFLLYVIGIVQLVSYISSFVNGGLDSWEMFLRVYIQGFRYYPVTVIADLLSILYTILILLTAVWLTAVKRNRELAEQSDALNMQIKRDFIPTGI